MGILHSTASDFYKLDKTEFRSFFTTGFIMPVIVGLLSVFVFYFFRADLKNAYGFPDIFFWVIPLLTFLTFCNEQLLSLARNNNEPMVYFKANISRTVIDISLSIVLVVVYMYRWEGRLMGILISYLLLAFYAFYYFTKRGYLFGPVKRKYIKEELIYAVPIIAMQASIFCMGNSDKFFLAGFTNDNNKTVGIYSIASIFGTIIIVFCTALLQYVFPKIYAQLSTAKPDYRSIRKHFIYYLAAITGASLLIIVFTPLMYHYFIHEQAYHSALRYIYILCAGYFLWCVTYFFYSYLLYHKQKKKLLLLSVCGIIASLGSNYIFIPRWHDYGAAIATLVGYCIVLILTLLFTKEFWQKFLFYNNKNEGLS